MQLTIPFLALAAIAAARTDLEGCTSSNVIAYGGASVLCTFLKRISYPLISG